MMPEPLPFGGPQGHRVLALLFFAVIGLLVVPSKILAGSAMDDPEALALALAKASLGRIEVTGQIVDEEGRPLNAVTVDIARLGPIRRLSWTESPAKIHSSATVDGAFRFRFERDSHVELTFRKDGYLPEQKVFSIELNDDQQMAVATGARIKPPVLTVRDLEVKLLTKTGVADLVDYGFQTIECAVSGSGQILDFSRRPSEAERRVDSVAQPGLLPPNSVSAQIARNRGGSFRIVRIPKKAVGADMLPPSMQTNTFYVPAEVRLVMTSAGDGFRVFEPQNRVGMFRQMRIAPTNGYQRELVVDGDYFASTAESLAKPGPEEEYLYFFCRFGKRYGKGVVGNVCLDDKLPSVSNDAPSTIAVRVKFLIQPDGSRDVGTEEDTVPQFYTGPAGP